MKAAALYLLAWAVLTGGALAIVGYQPVIKNAGMFYRKQQLVVAFIAGLTVAMTIAMLILG